MNRIIISYEFLVASNSIGDGQGSKTQTSSGREQVVAGAGVEKNDRDKPGPELLSFYAMHSFILHEILPKMEA